jgi:serine/threonine-protein kinase
MIGEQYVLAPQAELFAAEAMTASAQAQLGTKPGEFAITNTVSRATTIVLSAESAELLQRFREPVSVATAVAGYGADQHVDSHLVLNEAYPVLQHLIAAGFLVRAGAATEEVPEQVGDLRVLKLVQRLNDVMVLRACTPEGGDVAVKLLLTPADDHGRQELRREAGVLALARGCRVPGLVRDGTAAEQPYLATSWADGVPIVHHAARRRRPWEPGWRIAVLAMARGLLAAYAGLHERGILHADVHPKNVLMAPDGSVTLIDFALALAAGEPELGTARRAGALPYTEPEWAAAWRRGRPPPPATAAGEQHAVGALLYQMFTGQHYVSTLTGSGQLLERIATTPPAPFSDHGVPPWPAVEAVLARMLAKRPADRFGSVAEAAAALPPGPRRPGASQPGPATLLRATMQRLTRDGGLIDTGLTTAPRASVNYGAAGIAYFCYRLAQLRGEPGLLTAARRWLTRAHQDRDDPLAYQSPEIGLRRSRIGPVSIYHSPAGTACVDALVASAAGDLRRAGHALSDFVSTSQLPCPSPDLTIGRASTVVGAALLIEALGDTGLPQRHGLQAVGDAALAGVLRELPPDVAGYDQIRYRGIAHGWAGILYAALRWCEATGTPVPEAVADRLDQLGELSRRGGRGRYDIPMAGWCHGPAGAAQLWATALRVLGEPRHRELTVSSAEAAWAVRRGNPTLCCGLAGQGYAMLAALEADGDTRWTARAKRLASLAVQHAGTAACHPNSLWKGEVGIALLLADLADPGAACLPLFGREGWPAPVPRRPAGRGPSGPAPRATMGA